MNDIVVAHPATGEVIALATSSDEQIAQVREAIDEMALRLKQTDTAIGGEMLTRMDRAAEWTRRVRIGDREYTFTAPSPQAGSTEYDADLLELALTELVNGGIIDPDTADKALVREINVTIKVPHGASLDEFLEASLNLPHATAARASVKTHLPTITKLLKIAGAKDAVRASGSIKEPGERRVKFSVST